MIPGDAHVSIDGVLFTLATDEESHYVQRFEPLFAPSQAIAGEAASDNIRQEKIIWSMTDWSGGEGAVRYYPQNPTQYDQASRMNVTKRGQLTTRTRRRRSSTARSGANADTGKRPMGTSAYTHAIIAWEDNIVVASDAITWTSAQDTGPDMSTHNFCDAISDGTNAAFLHDTASTTSATPVVSAGASTTTWVDTDSGVTVNPATNTYVVGFVLDGLPYVWAARTAATASLVLYKKASVMSTLSDWGATTVFTSGIAPVGTWGTNFWTSAVAAETAAYISYSTKTHGFIWEIRADVARPFWTAPVGFAIKKLLYHMGILFAVGNQHVAGNTFAALWAIPITTRTPLLVSQPRQHLNTTLGTFSVGCAGNGPQLFLADEDSGKIFIYDIEKDATSLFDDLSLTNGDSVSFTPNTDKIPFLAMHGARLFTATWTPGGAGTSLQVISWDDLEVQNRDASQTMSATLESAEWDFGLPTETKRLNRFVVDYKVTDTSTTSGLVANSRIQIHYLADDGAGSAGAYVQAGSTITSATTPSGVKGRVVLTAPTGSSTVLFTRLKVKITLDNNSQAVAPPIVYSVMAEAEPAAYERVWELALRVEDETSNYRVTTRQETAQQVLDRLTTIKTNKQWVTFLDGFPSTLNNDYDSYTVCIDDMVADMKEDGTGIVRLRVRQQQS